MGGISRIYGFSKPTQKTGGHHLDPPCGKVKGAHILLLLKLLGEKRNYIILTTFLGPNLTE